jgi:hypothetical protein
MNNLLNEFISSIKNLISAHLPYLINNNFDLCFTYLNEAIGMNIHDILSVTYICYDMEKK